MKASAIIQARMTSTRLPGKVLLRVLDRPLLQYQIERLRRCRALDNIILAITDDENDQPLVSFCHKHGVEFYRGDEHNVLDRYYQTALKYSIETIVRITSDCPLIDPTVVDKVVNYYCGNPSKYDYVSNIVERTFPRGMDCEVVSFDALKQVHDSAETSQEQEHVTYGIYNRPGRYRIGSVMDQVDNSHHRWTVDCPEDFELIKRMIEALYKANPEFTMTDCLSLLDEHPDWVEINADVEQKEVSS